MMTTEHTIFCDLDGVLVDFDKGFSMLPGSGGRMPNAYSLYVGDDDAIWSVIEAHGKDVFFAELPWMPDGKELWHFINDNFVHIKILTALGRNDKKDKLTSTGKRRWLYRNIPELEEDDIIMVPNKHAKKHHTVPGGVLIDDSEICITGWKSRGGVGILHENAKNTISQLRRFI
jgi:hypothetical protein